MPALDYWAVGQINQKKQIDWCVETLMATFIMDLMEFPFSCLWVYCLFFLLAFKFSSLWVLFLCVAVLLERSWKGHWAQLYFHFQENGISASLDFSLCSLHPSLETSTIHLNNLQMLLADSQSLLFPLTSFFSKLGWKLFLKYNISIW